MIAEGWEIETEMAQLLDELTGIQTRLLDVLRAKRSAMSHGDLVSQRNLQTEEEAIYCALQDVQRRRGELLDRIRETGLSIDSLSEVPQHLENPVKENLSRKLGEATSLGRTVRLEQLTHWVVAQRSLLHISQMLEIIATGGRIRPTYGKSEFAARGSLVDHEA